MYLLRQMFAFTAFFVHVLPRCTIHAESRASEFFDDVSDESINIDYNVYGINRQGLLNTNFWKAGLSYSSRSNYLSALSDYATSGRPAKQKLLISLVVTGTGVVESQEVCITEMIPVWEKRNYAVFDYNLKQVGSVNFILARTFVKNLQTEDSEVRNCYCFKIVRECGSSNGLEILVFCKTIFSTTFLILGSITSPLLFKSKSWIVIIIAISTSFFIALIGSIEESVKEKGLSALICSLTVLTKCTPSKQPILIIRHYNHDAETESVFDLVVKAVGQFP